MSEKKRINQIAKESGLTNKELVDHAQKIGLPVKSHSSSIDAEQTKALLSSLNSGSTDNKATSKPVLDTKKETASQNRVISVGGKKVVSETETGNRPIVVGGKKVLSDKEIGSARVISVGGKTVAPVKQETLVAKTIEAKATPVVAENATNEQVKNKVEKTVETKTEVKAETPKKPERSEEHTSELQSPTNLVCRLLLEK